MSLLTKIREKYGADGVPTNKEQSIDALKSRIIAKQAKHAELSKVYERQQQTTTELNWLEGDRKGLIDLSEALEECLADMVTEIRQSAADDLKKLNILTK